jgi:hypothetical protein
MVARYGGNKRYDERLANEQRVYVVMRLAGYDLPSAITRGLKETVAITARPSAASRPSHNNAVRGEPWETARRN